MRLLDPLLRRPPPQRISGVVGVGRDGSGRIRAFHTILDRELPVSPRVVRWLRLASGDRVEFAVGRDGAAAHVAVHRRAR